MMRGRSETRANPTPAGDGGADRVKDRGRSSEWFVALAIERRRTRVVPAVLPSVKKQRISSG